MQGLFLWYFPKWKQPYLTRLSNMVNYSHSERKQDARYKIDTGRLPASDAAVN